nr:DUF418 domain-containing protein [Brevibacterium daeguense]
MLLLIAVANVSWYLWGHQTQPASAHPVDGNPLDRALAALTILFVDARIYPMFAFLFGYGMVQFARSREERGVPPQRVDRMLLRRHWWLIAFGAMHAALLFSGDVLGAYGLAGLLLGWLLFRRSDRAAAITVWSLVAVFVSVTVLGMMSAALLSLLPPEVLAADEGAEAFAVGPDLLNGQAVYWQSLLIRLGLWLAGTVGTVIGLAVPICVLFGWLAARKQWLEEPERHQGTLRTVAVWGILVGVLGALPQMLIYLDVLPVPDALSWSLAGLASVTGVAGGIGYAALFGLLARALRGRIPAALRPVAAVGRRSLTFYLLQSVIFAPLLAAWGLGLGPDFNTATAFALALGVWLLSLGLAEILERRNARGPAEVVLRRLTYGGDGRSSARGAGTTTPSDKEIP